MDQLKDNASVVETANKFTEFLNKITNDFENQNDKIADLSKRLEETEKNYTESNKRLEEAEKNSNEKIKKLEDDVKTLKKNSLTLDNKENIKEHLVAIAKNY